MAKAKTTSLERFNEELTGGAQSRPAVGDIVEVDFGKARRPLIVTSVNKDGTVNGNVQLEPGDNPTNDGNVKTHLRDVKV